MSLYRKIIFCFISAFFISVSVFAQVSKPRLIILADMGNEPDEVQQMVHMMMYSNEFDLEGLIAVTGKHLNPGQKRPYRRVLHPELFVQIIDAYEQDVDNLKKHASGWPDVSYLRSIVVNGQVNYGIAGTGVGESSKGSDLIVKSLMRDDHRPVYIVVNAGSNTLAQALIDIEASYDKEVMDKAISKVIVFENGAQDNAGAWICSKYPSIHWIRSNYQTYCYGGPMPGTVKKLKIKGLSKGPYTWEPYEYSDLGQHQWTLEHVIAYHGQLGKVYPLRQMGDRLFFLEGGGTIPWLGLVHSGLSDITQPSWGGWSGRFSSEKIKNVWSRSEDIKVDEETYGEFSLYTEVSDYWVDPETDSVYNNVFAPVYRWRRAFFNDFACRMDWCVADFEDANHNPTAAIDGDVEEKIHYRKVRAGETLRLDASDSTDPDGDGLIYHWWIYSEPGSYHKAIEIQYIDKPKVSLKIPDDASGAEIHLILELKDENKIASMSDYRRVVISVH